MNSGYAGPLRFGVFEFDPTSGNLRKRGLAVRLSPHAAALLSALLEPPLRIHTRGELQKRLWPEQISLDFEHGLNKIVHGLREALGDSGANARFIETVAGTGYRFMPDWLHSDSPSSSSQPCRMGCSVAVLPIHVTGTKPHSPLLSAQLSSSLTDALSGIPGLRVLAQSTVRSYKTLDANPQSAGQSMGVRSVLTGELFLSASESYLRIELIDVSDGAQLSAAFVEGPFCERHLVEGETGEKILRQLRPALLSLLEPAAGTARNSEYKEA